jgi:hypothetical protein
MKKETHERQTNSITAGNRNESKRICGIFWYTVSNNARLGIGKSNNARIPVSTYGV